MRSATTRTLRGVMRRYLSSALASISFLTAARARRGPGPARELRDELGPVVHREGVAHQFRHDGGAPGPGLHHLLLVGAVHLLDLLDHVPVDERPFLDAASHQRTPLSRRLMMNFVVRLLTRVL